MDPEIKAVALMTYDPGNPSIYVQGQVVFHDGSFYRVGEDNPSGIPDTSDDFTIIEWGSTTNYDVNKASNYQQGQIVTEGDNVYLVAKDKPEGTPGSSDDYVPLSESPVIPGRIINFSNGTFDPADPLTWPICATALEFPDIAGFTDPLSAIISLLQAAGEIPVLGTAIVGILNAVLDKLPIPGTPFTMSLSDKDGLPALLASVKQQAQADDALGTAGTIEVKNYIGHANTGIVPQAMGEETPALNLLDGPTYPVMLADGGTLTTFAAEFDALLSIDASIAAGGAFPLISTVAKIAAFITDTLTNAFGILQGVSDALTSVLTDAFGLILAPINSISQTLNDLVIPVPMTGGIDLLPIDLPTVEVPNIGTIIGTGLSDFLGGLQEHLGDMTDFLNNTASDPAANVNLFAALYHMPNPDLNLVDSNDPQTAIATPATITTPSAWRKVTEIYLGSISFADLAPVSNLSTVAGGLAGGITNLFAMNSRQDPTEMPTGQFLAGITRETRKYSDTAQPLSNPVPLHYEVNPGDYLMVGFETRLSESLGVFTGIVAPNASAAVVIE